MPVTAGPASVSEPQGLHWAPAPLRLLISQSINDLAGGPLIAGRGIGPLLALAAVDACLPNPIRRRNDREGVSRPRMIRVSASAPTAPRSRPGGGSDTFPPAGPSEPPSRNGSLKWGRQSQPAAASLRQSGSGPPRGSRESKAQRNRRFVTGSAARGDCRHHVPRRRDERTCACSGSIMRRRDENARRQRAFYDASIHRLKGVGADEPQPRFGTEMMQKCEGIFRFLFS